MIGNQTSHITVTYGDSDGEITCIYAIGEDTLRDFHVWEGQQKGPTGKDLQEWLEIRGCKLDSADGPALVRGDTDGTTVEIYFRDGEKHREDGPAGSPQL